jgi:hypothetical protein
MATHIPSGWPAPSGAQHLVHDRRTGPLSRSSAFGRPSIPMPLAGFNELSFAYAVALHNTVAGDC